MGKLHRNSPFGKHSDLKKLRFSGLSRGFKSPSAPPDLARKLETFFRVVRPWGSGGTNSRSYGGVLERSSSPGNEPGDACIYDRIEPHARGDFLSDLFDGVIGENRDIKILLDVTDASSCGERSRAALQRPGQ